MGSVAKPLVRPLIPVPPYKAPGFKMVCFHAGNLDWTMSDRPHTTILTMPSSSLCSHIRWQHNVTSNSKFSFLVLYKIFQPILLSLHYFMLQAANWAIRTPFNFDKFNNMLLWHYQSLSKNPHWASSMSFHHTFTSICLHHAGKKTSRYLSKSKSTRNKSNTSKTMQHWQAIVTRMPIRRMELITNSINRGTILCGRFFFAFWKISVANLRILWRHLLTELWNI